MAEWLLGEAKDVHPLAKENPCECGVKFYLAACKNATMRLTVNGFYGAINARMNPDLNKYFCYCSKD